MHREPNTGQAFPDAPGAWRAQARCRGVGCAAFIPDELGPTPPVVLELCVGCPVRAECEEHGRSTGSSGWWGGVFLRLGFTPKEWTRLRIWAKELVLSNEDPRRDVRAEIDQGRRRVLTQPIVDEMRERYAAGGVTQRQLAEDFKLPLDTVKGVIKRATWNGPQKPLRGEKAPSARLKNDDVVEIKRQLAAGERQHALAERYGVSVTTICNINTGRRWSSVS
jgi:hypothetical protein